MAHGHSAAITQTRPSRQRSALEYEIGQRISATGVVNLAVTVTEDHGLSALPALPSEPLSQSRWDGAGMNTESPTLNMSNYESRKVAAVLFAESLRKVAL